MMVFTSRLGTIWLVRDRGGSTGCRRGARIH